MGPKPADERREHDLLRMELVNLIDKRLEMVKLGALFDWQAFEAQWGPQFVSTTGTRRCPRG